jgi:Homeodomain-like domain
VGSAPDERADVGVSLPDRFGGRGGPVEQRDRNGVGLHRLDRRAVRGRFAQRGLDGLHDEPRPRKPRTIRDEDVERVIVKTLEEQPKDATHWSTRSMAAATRMSQSALSLAYDWPVMVRRPRQLGILLGVGAPELANARTLNFIGVSGTAQVNLAPRKCV